MSNCFFSNEITKGEMRTRKSARTTNYGSKKNGMKNHYEKFIFVLFYINNFQSTRTFLQFICFHNTFYILHIYTAVLHTVLTYSANIYHYFHCSQFSYVECSVFLKLHSSNSADGYYVGLDFRDFISKRWLCLRHPTFKNANKKTFHVK